MARRICLSLLPVLMLFASAAFAAPQYTLTTQATHGKITLDPPGGVYDSGAFVSITAVPDSGWYFSKWSSNVDSKDVNTIIYLDSNTTVSATFLDYPTNYCEAAGQSATGADYISNVIFNTIDNASTLETVPSTEPVYGDFSAISTDVIPKNSYMIRVTLNAVFPLDRIFAWIDWNRDGEFGEDEVVLSTSTALDTNFVEGEVYIPANAIIGKTRLRVRVQYDATKAGSPCGTNLFGDVEDYTVVVKAGTPLPKYKLNITSANGVVTQFRAPNPDTTYDSGKVVTLTAKANVGYEFAGWSGDLSGTENPVVITMDGTKNVTATYTSVATFKITTAATNGTIILDPAGGEYNVGTEVTITAKGDAGYLFKQWSGDLSGLINGQTITIDANKTIGAEFMAGQTQYCEAGGNIGTGGDFISNVTFGDISNASSQAMPAKKVSYSDYTSLISNAEVGKTYSLTVALNATFAPDRIFAWVDWNQDNTFDYDEMTALPVPSGNEAKVDITVPATATAGLTRMRIRVQYDSTASGDACGTTLYGEVEDYSVNVLDVGTKLNGVAGLVRKDGIKALGNNSFIITSEKGAAYSVFDVSGRIVLRGVLSAASEKVSFSNLHKGLYVVRLGTRGRQVMQKALVK